MSGWVLTTQDECMVTAIPRQRGESYQIEQNGMIWQSGKLAGDLLAAPLQASQVSKKE
jgi:hypothetical protein